MNSVMKFRLAVLRAAEWIKWLPTVLARLTLGAIFIDSGWMKLTNLSKATAYFTDLGIPSPGVMVPFVSLTELVCGALVFAGCFTRVATVPLTVVMMVAILVAKRATMGSLGDLFGMNEFLYMVLLAGLFVQGAGRFSVDAWLLKQFGGGRNAGSSQDRNLRAA